MRQAYICGPYTSSTEDGTRANIRAALGYSHALVASGWFPICPHASGFHHATWDEAMERCRSIIRGLDPNRDALVTLPGWLHSKGSKEEVQLAEQLGIPVLSVDEAMGVVAHEQHQ
jgi:hypothetical protein